LSNFDLLLRLLLQLIVILAVCRTVGWLGRFAGQTQVIGEMIAGVLLGPSLLGLLAPDAQAWLFPKAGMPLLYAISQCGLVLYMFLVGLEFDTAVIRGRLRSAGLISASGIIVPFVLGGALAWNLGNDGRFFTAQTSLPLAAMYMGAAMSITAFPVLARILQERGILKTRIGTVTLAAGSLDDAMAWCLLAFILAAMKSNTSLSVYAVLGAFVCGACMPRRRFAAAVQKRLGPVTQSLLVPIYFVYSGLNTRIGLLGSSRLWMLTAVVIGVAIIGKGLACALAARASGAPWRESWTIAALMNTRGLMELIILNIGLERGLITQTLFTIMVLMAIVTTVMASPLFSLIYARSTSSLRGVESALPRT